MNAAEFSALPDVQRMSATAKAYQALGDSPARFGGKLLLCAEMGERGFAYSVAMSIAGGTFLGIDPRPQRLKEALRDSVCDYMVNTLDEALRILKNEIRKKTQVSVGLVGEVGKVLGDAAERGVQPEYFVAGETDADESIFEVFRQRGAVDAGCAAATGKGASLVIAAAASVVTMNSFESAVATVLSRSDAMQVKWAESSPRYFRRTTPPMQSVLLDEEQIARLEQQLMALEGLTLAVQSSECGWRLLKANPA